MIAIDRFEDRLRLARTAGAEALDYTEIDVVEALKEKTGGMGPDACIDAVGMEAVHGHGALHTVERMKQATRSESERD